MLSWFLAEHAQSSPRLYTNNKKSRRILCDIPSIQIRSADIFSSFYEKFWSSLHQKKTNMFFSTSSSIYVWWWTWSSILRAEQEFFFFHKRFLWRFIIKIMLWYLKAFLLSLLWYLLVFCALQKCKCVCISVDVYFVVVHKMFIL